jgi:glycosyltransferase involved in cell wall biosynthesis
MNQELPNISVVIATLGGGYLANTIATINTGVLTPSEILICIPEELSARVSAIRDSNVRIIRTPFRGQVAQRAEGFKHAREPLVLQLDDDIDLQPDTLLLLAQSIEQIGRKNVVGPVFLNKISGGPLSPFAIGLKGQLVSL